MDGFLTPGQFPLFASGASIYGRLLSSPILTAPTPQAAAEIAHWLNDYAAIKMKVERDGPTLVHSPSHRP